MINIGISIAIGIGAYILCFLCLLLYKYFRLKHSFREDLLKKGNLINVGLFVLLYGIFLLIIYLNYVRTSYFSIITLAFSSALATVFVPFDILLDKIRDKRYKTINYWRSVGYIGAILLLILEVSLFANSPNKSDSASIEVSFDSALIIDTDGEVTSEYIKMDGQRKYITFDNSSRNMNNIYIDVRSEIETKMQVDIYVSDNGEKFSYKKSYQFNPLYGQFEYFNLSDYNNNKYIKITFVIDETNVHDKSELRPIYVEQITINRGFPFTFNVLRYAILVGIFTALLLILRKGNELRFKEVDNITLLTKIILLLCGIGLVYIIVNSLICFDQHYVPIGDVSGESDNIYYQLFDAVKKWQTYLDVKPSDSLLACPNPYDPSARQGVSFLWDHAYYHGAYYCYYGIAPVFLIMFPIYWLSGCNYIPSTSLILELGTLFSILTFLLALLMAIKIFMKKVNFPVLIFILIAGLFTSLLLSNNIYKVGYYSEGIYRIPYAYGLTFLFLTYYLLFKAYNDQKHRIIYLGLIGLSVVLMMASRPTLIFALLLTVPLFIKMLVEKYPWKKKIIDYLPMFGVLVIGAFCICLYNYSRFDSIFEFGQTYQLTVTDNTKLAYSYKGLVPTLFNFYITPPKYNSSFPFFSYGYLDVVEKYHVYNSGGIGILFFPLLWVMFALPFLFNKNDDIYQRIMYYMAPFIVFILAFTTYCFAGFCPRYMVEITSVATFFSIVPLLTLFNRLYEINKKATLFMFAIIGGYSIFFSANLLFLGFDGWREGDVHGLLEVIRMIYNQFNI